MGAITRININNLFWLGRYVERVFTTLNSFFKYADRFIEGGQEAYEKYLADINVPDIYKDSEDFFHRYVFDMSDPNSIISNLDRALGNGIVLREEIKTPSLSYLQMAMDKFKACEGTDKIRYDMLPVRDAIYAFWGSVDNNMTNGEALRVIHLGKSVERADMFLRLGYPSEDISAELDNLIKHVARYGGETSIISADAFEALKTAARSRDYRGKRAELIDNIERLVEVNFLETASV
ncbi:MAG: alpha-E domain-containing protein [Huintestinicola sp.]|uniref:alpha-E domain-containing protein n=1 Tax=Huintestinicola sp. TaxID=2981661 RepID=UPI003F023D08